MLLLHFTSFSGRESEILDSVDSDYWELSKTEICICKSSAIFCVWIWIYIGYYFGVSLNSEEQCVKLLSKLFVYSKYSHMEL